MAKQPSKKRYVVARDGLPARNQGPWARDKLRFLREYLPPAIAATRRKAGRTYYLDLFAGPGRNARLDETGQPIDDFPGSPLLALEARYVFKDGTKPRPMGHFHFCNLNGRDNALLQRRVARFLHDDPHGVSPDRIHYHNQDSNELIRTILQDIPTWAYILAFADIEGPRDLAFDSLRELRQRHTSVDLYILYPTRLGIERLFTWDVRKREMYRAVLDRYFGTSAWWEIVQERKTRSQSHAMRHRLQALYMQQLRGLWTHVSVAMLVRTRRGRYDMLFATDHKAAISIADSARRRSAELGLFDGLS